MAEKEGPGGTTPVKLKAKYTLPKTRGRYKSSGGTSGKVNKRQKKGAKTYVYGSRVMYLSPSGKTRMGAPRPE